MNKHERLAALLDSLSDRGRMSVSEIVELLGASPATVRRDLDELAQQQLILRTRGGAAAVGGVYDLPLRYRAARNADEKDRIALAANRLISSGTVVGLNGGTTTTTIAREIGTRTDFIPTPHRPGITVVTNAVNIAHELTVRPHVRIIMPGGVARTQSFELIGPSAEHVMEGINLDIAMLGVDAISPTDGATAHNEGEAKINQLFASRAKKVVIVTDSSKVGQVALARICTTSQIDALITDDLIDLATRDTFIEMGIEVIIA